MIYENNDSPTGLYLRKLRLVNYCNFEDQTFEFVKSDGTPYKFVCFFGPNGIGKCVSGDTYVIAKAMPWNSGMVKIRDLFPKDLTDDTWYNAADSGVFEVFSDGYFFPVKNIYYNGVQPAIRLKTRSGFSITGSKERHQVLSVKNGQIQFVKLSDLTPGDIVCIDRHQDTSHYTELSWSLSRLLGYLVSEGDFTGRRARFTNYDYEVLEDYCDCAEEYFGIRPEIKPRGYVDLGKNASATLLKIGLTAVKSGEKTVPASILKTDHRAVANFLRAYFEGDGGVEKDICAVTCCSKSELLIEQIQLLLLRLGVVAVRSKKNASYNDLPYTSWRLTIQGENVEKFAQAVGFVSTRKNKELASLLNLSRNPNRDLLPKELASKTIELFKTWVESQGLHFSRIEHKQTWNGLHCLQPNYLETVKEGVSRQKLLACSEKIQFCGVFNLYHQYFFDRVESLEECREELFDLCVDEKHRFWTNGFISHNSTLLEAVSMLTMNSTGREAYHVRESLKKYIRNPDYDPAFEHMKGMRYDKCYIAGRAAPKLPDMLIEGTYVLDGKDYVIQMNQDGYLRNDFAPLPPEGCEPEDAHQYLNSGPWGSDHLTYRQRIAHFITADNDLSMNKFQLHYSQMESYEQIISEIMRYKADCVVPSGITPLDNGYCTDFVITKRDHRIHFKRMSAGERKICKSFSDLLNLMRDLSCPEPGDIKMDGWPRLLLLDNVEMHVYYDRHITLIECLKRVFKKQQIFATTHSGVLIQRFLKEENDRENELWIDLEQRNG
jgi:intein/homing endonuclease